MIDCPYSKIKFVTKPASALISFSEVRKGDLILVQAQYGSLAFFCVESTFTNREGVGSMWEDDKGHRLGIGVDEITDIPVSAQFVVYRKHWPDKAKKAAATPPKEGAKP